MAWSVVNGLSHGFQQPGLDSIKTALAFNPRISNLRRVPRDLLVKRDQGFRLLVIHLEAIAHCLLKIVNPLNQWIASDIIQPWLVGGIMFNMIDSPGRFVNAPTT